MPWKITFNQDTDKVGEGTVIANYSDDTIQSLQVERRINTDDPNAIEDFINEAKEALTIKQKEISDLNVIANKIEAVLNG